MPKGVIQVAIDEPLHEAHDALARESGRPRSGLIPEARQRYVLEEEQSQLDAADREGYRRVPEESAVGEARLAMLGQVLPEESW